MDAIRPVTGTKTRLQWVEESTGDEGETVRLDKSPKESCSEGAQGPGEVAGRECVEKKGFFFKLVGVIQQRGRN